MFGYAGHGAVGLLDGVYNHQDDIKIIFPRIESAAGYMADAYFRASGQVIPVYTSTGPGPMLLTVAMGNAFYDSSAFIAITGQVATNQYDSGALQEEYRHHQADFPSMAKVITKRSFQAQSVDDLGKFLPKAFKLARTGRPGPVHIDVPYDLWIRTADVEVPEPEERSQHLEWRTPGSPEAVGRALEMLMKAKRPLVLAGGGVIASDATEQLRQFAEHVNVPGLLDVHGQGRAVGAAPAPPGHRRLLGRVPGVRGGEERGRDPRDRLSLLRHPLFLVGAGLHVQHPAHEADPRRPRPPGDRPQLPDRAGDRRRRARGAEAADRARRPRARSANARPGTTRSRRGRRSGRTSSSRRRRATSPRSTPGAWSRSCARRRRTTR